MFGRLGNEAFTATKNNVDVLGNIIENVSNVNSIGYKKGQISFVETLNGEISKQENKDFSQGPLRKTGDIFDFALDGPGFFEVELPSGQRAYTRAGRFRLSSEGELVTLEEGYRVIPGVEQQEKPVVEANNIGNNDLGLNIKVTTPKLIIPSDVVPEILEDGTVNGINSVTGEKAKIGKINVVVFNNPQGLESVNKGYFLPAQSSGPPQDIEVGPNTASKVKQGFLEFGNVDIATEFLKLSQVKNILSAQLKLLKTIDKIHEQANYTIAKSV